jgi:hypothetical protein
MDDTRIAVRVTQLGEWPAAQAEMAAAEGLFFDPLFKRWYCTQAELDTPHVAFRLSPL